MHSLPDSLWGLPLVNHPRISELTERSDSSSISPSCPAILILGSLDYVTMNILESQVTDLNYLAESPIAFTGSMSGQHQSSSTESPAETGTNSGKKRKIEEANGNGNVNTHTRAKRNRYISIAWWVISIFPVQLVMTFCAGVSTQPPTECSS